jgi:hypothetical protein
MFAKPPPADAVMFVRSRVRVSYVQKSEPSNQSRYRPVALPPMK